MATEQEMSKGADGCCETMTVQGPKGPMIINKSDFDERIHKAPDEKKSESQEPNKPAPRIVEATGTATGKAKG